MATAENGAMRLETITPKQAFKYLQRNKKNRRINRQLLKFLAAEIKEGRWQVNGDTIRFAKSGDLLDGQHRLEAIILANQSVKTWVLRGLPEQAQRTMDTGKNRSFSDALHMEGFKDPFTLSSGVRFHMAFMKPGFNINDRVAPDYGFEWLDKHQGLQASTKRAVKLGIRKVSRAAGPAVAIHYLGSRKHRQKADRFLEALALGHNLGKTSAVYHLREQLIQMQKQQVKFEKDVLAKWFCKAWLLTVSGKRVNELKILPADGYKIARGK